MANDRVSDLRKLLAPYVRSIAFSRLPASRQQAWLNAFKDLPANAVPVYAGDLDRMKAEPEQVAEWLGRGHDVELTTAAVACKIDLETYEAFAARGFREPALIRAMLDCGDEAITDAVAERFPSVMARYWGLLWDGMWDIFDASDDNETLAFNTMLVSQYAGTVVRTKDTDALLPIVATASNAYAPHGGFPLRQREVSLGLDTVLKAGRMFSYARWRETQGLYRFNPDLARELISTKFDAHFPVEPFFYLPERTVWIPVGPSLRDALAIPDLYGIVVSPMHYYGEQRLYFEFHTINGTLDILSATGEADFRYGVAQERPELISAACSLALYLATPDADLIGEPRTRDTRKIKGGTKTFPPANPQMWEVGTRIGSMFRQYREAAANRDRATGPQRGPIPHVRVAHWHRFWYGPRTGQRQLRARWLPPIKVGFKGQIELPAVVHPVEP